MPVTNTGDRAGDEVVQVYLRDTISSVTRPVKELVGFQRITLQPGETRQIDYKVRKGDTLFAIARRFEVTVAQLQDWNGMLGSTALRAGQTLTIHVNARRDFGG